MDDLKTIEKVREFNRFYMPAMRLLGNHYLGSEYSAAEARILFEIYENEGCNAAHIASVMGIDKSYLSKILAGQEKAGFLQRIPSREDRRSCHLVLTEQGRARAETLIQKSNEEIGEILQVLSGDERLQLVQALDRVIKLLKRGGSEHDRRSV